MTLGEVLRVIEDDFDIVELFQRAMIYAAFQRSAGLKSSAATHAPSMLISPELDSWTLADIVSNQKVSCWMNCGLFKARPRKGD